MKSFAKRIRFVLFVLVAADLIGTFVFLGWVHQHAEELQETKSDVGIVLFHDFDQRRLGAETRRRVNFAAALFERGRFDHIICAGGARPRSDLYGSELMKRALRAAGIPSSCVVSESRSKDTRSNIQEALGLMKQKGWERATIVSSPLHIHRVKRLIRNTEGILSLSLVAYPYRNCQPEAGWGSLWLQTHYEWAAHVFLASFPSRLYTALVDFLRP